MEPKVLFLIALLAPILILAAGLFVHPKSDEPSMQPEETAS